MREKIRKLLGRIKPGQEEDISGDASRSRMRRLRRKLMKHRHLVRSRNVRVTAILFLILFVSGTFLFFHTGSRYFTAEHVERRDINGTRYMEFGNYFLKYSPDGASCVDSHSKVRWSTTFTMQVPVADVCGTTAVVAEQQGTQVYVFDSKGLKGQFQTLLPIEKVRVARQGVVGVVLDDEEVTWINLYEPSGEMIAENRTSISDSGYPVDIALSPDGMKLGVSFVQIMEGQVDTDVVFYNFDSVGQTQANNKVSEMNCGDVMAPRIVFGDNGKAVAFRTDGFTVFSGRQAPKEKKTIKFEQEILSVFYDDIRFGFVFASAESEHKYQMQVYNMNGKKLMQKYFDLDYDSISFKKDKIVMFNEQEFAVYKLNGQKQFEGMYRKPIQDIMDVRGFRKYMIITQDSADLIRLG